MTNRENIYRIETERESKNFAQTAYAESDEGYCRIDSIDSDAESSPMDRREAALHARIAQFETIVRKTKLDMAQRLDDIKQKNLLLEKREQELRQREEVLQIQADELARREAAFERRISDFSQNEIDYLERTESLVKSETDFQISRDNFNKRSAEFQICQENFNNRSAALLEKIRSQKVELEKLLSQTKG